jgi:hypothetical protein
MGGAVSIKRAKGGEERNAGENVERIVQEAAV